MGRAGRKGLVMAFSKHIRLRSGTLKIKTRGALRYEERYRQVPVTPVGPLYFVWVPDEQDDAPSEHAKAPPEQ